MTNAGKKALEELVADDTKNPPTIWLQSWEDTRGEGQDRLWCQDKVWPDHEDDHEPVKYVRADLAATLEARATAAEERVKRLEEATRKLLACPAISDVDHWDAEYGDPDTAEAQSFAMKVLTGDKPKTERPTVNDSLTILRRLADGDTIVYSQDGDMGWFTKGDRAFVGDKITMLRACGFIKSEIDPTDETDNYRGMAEYDTISDLGRRYLKEQSR